MSNVNKRSSSVVSAEVKSEVPEQALVVSTNAMEWTCKMRAPSDKQINRLGLMLLVGVTLFVVIATFPPWKSIQDELDIFLLASVPAYSMGLFMFWCLRQKTIYNYKIHSKQGECEDYLYYPSWAEGFFKSVAGFSCLLFFGAALFMGSLVPLLGAGALGLGYAGRLLGWKNEVNVELSQPWNEHAFLTLDYKRKIIVTHHSNMLYGFELRFPHQALFDECLVFLKTVLPQDIEILIKDWDAHDASRLDG